MKILSSTLSLVLFMITLPSYAQETIEDNFATKYELSIVIDDIFDQDLTYGSSGSNYYSATYNTTKVGLGYKYHFANSAFRSKISFGSRDVVTDQINDRYKTEDSFSTLRAFIGYELHKNTTKSQFFYGLDVFVNYSDFHSKSTDYEDFPNTSDEDKFNTIGIGVSPLIGVKYFFNSMVSVSTEVKFSIESYKKKIVDGYNRDWLGEKIEESGLFVNFGPVGQLSINIHL